MSRLQLLQASLAHYTASIPEGPIVNVNLISLHGRTEEDLAESARALLKYWRDLGKLVASSGGRALCLTYVARSEGPQAHLHPWDLVSLVYYPSLGHYRNIMEADAFLTIKHLRRASVKQSVLYAAALAGPLAELERIVTNRPFAVDVRLNNATMVDNDTETVGLQGIVLLVGNASYFPWKHFVVSSSGSASPTALLRVVPFDGAEESIARIVAKVWPSRAQQLSNL